MDFSKKLPDDVEFPAGWPVLPAFPYPKPERLVKREWPYDFPCRKDCKNYKTTITTSTTPKYIDPLLYKFCQDYTEYYELYQRKPNDQSVRAILSHIWDTLEERVKEISK